jgi:chromosome partitioning protein
MRRMRSIAFMNQKGGVGKTTCAVNLGAALAERGQRVLLVDMDPQANLSLHLDLDIHTIVQSTYSVLCQGATVEQAVIRDVRERIDVLPANIDLSGAEVELVSAFAREGILRDSLRVYLATRSYDFILIDCPPSLGLLSLNALTYVREVFIPLQTEYFALQGMTRLLDVVELIRSRLNPELSVTMILPTMFDPRTKLSSEVVGETRSFFGDKVARTVVRTNVRLAEAPSHGQTILEYDSESRGAEDFRALAREVLGELEPAGSA